MKSIIALEDLIQENEERIKLFSRQLSEHESGEYKLSALKVASAETNLEKTEELISKYKTMLEELKQQDQAELEEKERLEEAIRREKYFKNQYMRIKKANQRSNDHKLEAMMILDELPSGIGFEDDELFDVAQKSIDLNITNHLELKGLLNDIKNDFQKLIKNNSNKSDIKDLMLLNYQIPILVLQFSVLLANIKENLEKDRMAFREKKMKEKLVNKRAGDKKPTDEEEAEILAKEKKDEEKFKFNGFPKFQDWWIDELWTSHQAYFALFKWKSIIGGLCKTSEQKRAWSAIFDNWICVKKMINVKGKLGFEYNYAFDTLIGQYAEFEEETTHANLVSMESIIKTITKKENFLAFPTTHNIVTPYLLFKRDKDRKTRKI